MEYLNGNFLNWKKLLLAGLAEGDEAVRAGALMAQIHRYSDGDPEAKRLFDTTENFYQLRIEPYLLATGKKHPALRPLFEAEAERLAATREGLVHGDFSPKNILAGPDRMVILDCEVAWYGDPAFDLAFLLSHFFLKALFHAPRDVGMRAMIEKFWFAYVAIQTKPLGTRPVRLLLMVLLARVDGKSPVEYLDSPRQNIVRKFVGRMLPGEEFFLGAITEAWFSGLSRIEK
jgi:Ser/Thr protein kinase RdoA (MazF antagonist)